MPDLETCKSFVGSGSNRRPCSRTVKNGGCCWQHTPKGSEESKEGKETKEGKKTKSIVETTKVRDVPKEKVKTPKLVQVEKSVETKKKKVESPKASKSTKESISLESPKVKNDRQGELRGEPCNELCNEHSQYEESLLEYFGDYESYNVLQQKISCLEDLPREINQSVPIPR